MIVYIVTFTHPLDYETEILGVAASLPTARRITTEHATDRGHVVVDTDGSTLFEYDIEAVEVQP